MSENVEDLEAKIADLEKRIVELDSENQKLRQTFDEVIKTLQVYVNREKEAAINAIMEKANWDEEELEKMDLPSLRLILRAVDSSVPDEINTTNNEKTDGTVWIVKHPTASFTYSPIPPIENHTVTFNTSSSSLNGGNYC